jgi:hypothetical protein
MEEITFRRLPNGTKAKLKRVCKPKIKTMTQLFKEWVEGLREPK